jgi:DNA ligase-1
MLSATLEDTSAVRFPVLASPKLDGIRCLIIDGKPVSRNLKAIPNQYVQDYLGCLKLPPLDGELIVGDPKAKDCYRKTNSGVMSRDGEPNFTFWVFDMWDADAMFVDRLGMVRDDLKALGNKRIRIVPHLKIDNEAKLLEFESNHLIAGYEGVMGRSIDGLYKHGRATMREGSLWKLKRFSDGEARIVGFDEQMHNANELTRDNLGRAKRSSHKENKVAKGTLGALKVVDVFSGVDFDIGTGFTDADRDEIWANREDWVGTVVKYKSMKVGVKDRPRHPVYLGVRQDI